MRKLTVQSYLLHVLILLILFSLPINVSAVRVDDFIGAETGGTEEVSVPGATTATTNNPKKGVYNYNLTGAVDARWTPYGWQGVSAVAANYIFGGYYSFPDVTPTANIEMLSVVQFITGSWNVYVNTSGNVIVVDRDSVTQLTISAPFSASTYYLVEFYIVPGDPSGTVEVFINGISQGVATGDFITTLFDDPSLYYIGFETTGSDSMDLDNFYALSEASSASDRLGENWELIKYQTDTTGTTPDANGPGTGAGSTLDSGLWESNAQTPMAINSANYTSTPANGSVDMPGPSGDANIDGSNNIRAIKGVWSAARGSGAGSTHTIYLGNNGGAASDMMSKTVALDTTYIGYTFGTSSASIMPLSTELGRQGFGVDGAQDFLTREMWYMVLHVPDSVVVETPPRTVRLFKGFTFKFLGGKLYIRQGL